jgi:hypothetical protein
MDSLAVESPAWLVWQDPGKTRILRKTYDSMSSRKRIREASVHACIMQHPCKFSAIMHHVFYAEMHKSDVTVESTVGVKQGDSLEPVVFSQYFQACMEVLADQWVFEKPLSAYKLDNVLTGRKYNVKPDAYSEFYLSLYADDGAFLLTSRKEVEEAVPLLFSVLKAFGLSMHVGRNGNKAKTEAVFYPSAARIKNPDPVDAQDIEVDGGIVSFTKQFKYLGSLIADKLTDDAECDARISAA